jgi:hypothetical protein
MRKRVLAVPVLIAVLTGSSQLAAAQASDTTVTTEPTGPAALAPDLQPLVEFTACKHEVAGGGAGWDEFAIPSPDGEVTLSREYSNVGLEPPTDVSDPRLDGSWGLAWNEDEYVGPRGEWAADVVTVVWRIENAEGAWQGSSTWARFPDDEGDPHFVLAGEGAYEGLTAVVTWFSGECPNVRGYILALGIPEEGTFPDD